MFHSEGLGYRDPEPESLDLSGVAVSWSLHSLSG